MVIRFGDKDLELLRLAFQLAIKSREHGNSPFGSILADREGAVLLKAENSTSSDRDCTAHSDVNLVRDAFRRYSPEFLAGCSLYTSSEPCAMCAGATIWANIQRVVYGLGIEILYKHMGRRKDGLGSCMPCRDVFKSAHCEIQVIGPLLEEEAIQAHLGFW